jgi:hypothetical protein
LERLVWKEIWSSILNGKYLKNLTLVEWVKNYKGLGKKESPFWRGFLKFYPVIGNLISWKIGNGEQLRLGIDPFVNGEYFY